MERIVGNRAVRIARAYAEAPIIAPEATRAYLTLTRYVRERFGEALAQGWTFTRDTTGEPPDLARAFAERMLPVYDLQHAHPLLSDLDNWRFRAVHDVFGHVNAPFGFAGEVIAARAQLADFRRWAFHARFPLIPYYGAELAACALWSEIVGQAAYYTVHGAFPVQKAALLWSVYNARS